MPGQIRLANPTDKVDARTKRSEPAGKVCSRAARATDDFGSGVSVFADTANRGDQDVINDISHHQEAHLVLAKLTVCEGNLGCDGNVVSCQIQVHLKGFALGLLDYELQ